MMNKIEAAAILAVSLTAGIVTFIKVAFPELGNVSKKDESEIEVELDIDDSEVEPE